MRITTTASSVQSPIAQALSAADTEFAAFLTRLLRDAAPDEVVAFGAHALVAEARILKTFVGQRPVGRHSLRLRQTLGGDGTIIEIVNDDMPFLVDSVMAEILARGHSVRLILHPLFKATRDPSGHLSGALEAADQRWGDGRQESVMLIVLRPLNRDEADALGRRLGEILTDVRRAVADWAAMRQVLVDTTAVFEPATPTSSFVAPNGTGPEARAFLQWLADGHFTLLGTRRYALDTSGQAVADAQSGLGLLRDPGFEPLAEAKPVAAPDATRALLDITKSRLLSRVHRRAPLDVIRIRMESPTHPHAHNEMRIVGLFTSSAYVQPPRQIPFLRDKVQRVVAQSGHPAQSHAAKALANVLDTFPRDELFQIDGDELARWAEAIVDLELRPRVRVFARRDRLDRFVSVLVYAPRDRYSSDVRKVIGHDLAQAFGCEMTSFQPAFLEAGLVRIHFVLARNSQIASPEPTPDVEALVALRFRTWDDRLEEVMEAHHKADGRAGGVIHPAVAAFAPRLPTSYRDAVLPQRALIDMAAMAALTEAQPLRVDFHRPDPDPLRAGRRMLATVMRRGQPMPLSDRVPLLENLGFSVIDESTHLISEAGASPRIALHLMELETDQGPAADAAAHDNRLEDAFLAVAHNRTANDAFNRLVTVAAASWREVAILRAYAGYLRQLGVPFGMAAMAETLSLHGGIVRDLIELFHLRFNPDMPEINAAHDASQHLAHDASQHLAHDAPGRLDRITPLLARLDGALGAVKSLDEDRILRHLLGLIRATVRTNAFQHPLTGPAGDALAFKLDPKRIEAMPDPKPFREIWVSGPRVDGVHMRFQPVARGGLRWSDRATDFRTEVLGLVKAQLVKNAVIVPSGAKGGFVPKLLPRNGTRDAIQAEGIAAYKVFIGALLDLTDTIRDGQVVPPQRVIRHDGDDPYLVVAADKGTATFSDIANGLSVDRGHWLGDAFASGGSQGYDHKKMGITARGAWECVKRHFREMDLDIQSTPITVVGVGDMSGDVFGNGMLLSRHLKLVAAFDHRDIFIDPTPDPATSFAERARLFALQRSSWQDYDTAKLSGGGGIFSRSAKSIALTPEIRSALGIVQPALSITPAELMRSILEAKADLLWFGGIGTYVRATTETDDQAGDRANDAIRVTGQELKVSVIGEGANLALTQRGRMEFAKRGGRLNTDFIDNSAGVNSSDQEVNIKIALAGAIAAGTLQAADRNALLASMTDDVAMACLKNNHVQGLALTMAVDASVRDVGAIGRLMDDLETRGLLNRRLEALPSRGELTERARAGLGLSRPEMAPLLSFAKIALTDDILKSRLPEGLAPMARAYFPPTLQARFPASLDGHRLVREIAATEASNTIINRLGPTTLRAMADASGRPIAEMAGSALSAMKLLGIDQLWADIDALDGHLREVTQRQCYAAVQRAVESVTLGLFRARIGVEGPSRLALTWHQASHRVLERLAANRRAVGPDPALVGVPQALAARLASLNQAPTLPLALALIGRTATVGQPLDANALDQGAADAAVDALTAVADVVPFAQLALRANTVPTADYYDRLALMTSQAQFESAHRRLAEAALDASSATPAQWVDRHGDALKPLSDAIGTILAERAPQVSRMTVAAGQISEQVLAIVARHRVPA